MLTDEDLLRLCDEAERDGVDYVVLKVRTRREPAGWRMRILPGVTATVLGTERGYAVVRAPVAGLRRFIARARDGRTQA